LQNHQPRDESWSWDAGQLLKPRPMNSVNHAYRVPPRRKGFAIVRGRRLFQGSRIPPGSRDPLKLGSFSALALNGAGTGSADKRGHMGRFAIVRGR